MAKNICTGTSQRKYPSGQYHMSAQSYFSSEKYMLIILSKVYKTFFPDFGRMYNKWNSYTA